MKVIMTGRRAPNQTFTEMKNHMLAVHGPLVKSEMGTKIASYVQNHVYDGRYGSDAPAGRDMVAEVSFPPGCKPPEKSQKVIDDEPKFAHQSDLFPLLTEEQVIIQSPIKTGGAEVTCNFGYPCFKVLCYLAPKGVDSVDDFLTKWKNLDTAVSQINGVTGYVKSIVLPQSPPLSPYKGVAGLWFTIDNYETGLASWHELIASENMVDDDTYFCVYVEEHKII